MSKRICFILIIYKHFHLCCFTAFAYTTTDIVYLFPRTQFLYSVFDKIGRGFGSPEELEIDFFSIQGYWLKGRLHNSTQLDVELSTRSQREQLSPISSERCRSWRHIWCVFTSLPGDGILEWRIWRKVNRIMAKTCLFIWHIDQSFQRPCKKTAALENISKEMNVSGWYITHHNAALGTKTRLTCFALIGCTLFNWVSCISDRRRQLSCVGEGVYSDATQLDVDRVPVGRPIGPMWCLPTSF